MQKFSPRTQGLIAINVAAFIFGSAALFGKINISPFWIVAMRAAFAVATLLILGICKKEITVPPRRLWLTIAATGVILAVHWLTFFASVQMAGVAIATLTFATFPLFTVLIEAFRQRRKPHLAEIAASITIIFAIGLLVHPQNGQGSLLGACAGLASGLTYAIFWHAGKKLSADVSPLQISFWQNVVTASVLIPFLPSALPMPSHATEWLCLLLLGVVNTALMLQFYLYALKRISASTCSGFVALEPVYAILLAAAFFHEPLTIWIAVSATLIIGASFTLLKLESHS